MQYRPCLALAVLMLLFLPKAARCRYTIQWAPSPAVHSIPDSLKTQSAVFVLEEKVIELVEEQRGREKAYKCYRSVHHIIHLNDNRGVDAFNTFSLSVGRNRAADEVRARTILPSGKIVEVGKEQIKEVKNEDGEQELKLALEHVELGCEVELIFTQEVEPSSDGTEVFQFDVPVQTAIFRLIVPEGLRYDLKGYNGFPNPTDSLADGRHYYTANAANIRDLQAEPYSRYRPLQMRVDYKLSYVDGDDANVRRLTWSDYAKQLHKIYRSFSESEQREATKMLAAIGIKESEDDLAKALAIEDYFKTNISISNDLIDDDAGDFRNIARRKQATERNYVRFFAACVAAAGIPFEIGVVNNRYTYGVDEDLEIWDRLDGYVLYFPKLKAYMAPSAVTLRYPYLPYQLCGTKGLFTKTTSLGSMVSALPDMRDVPHTSLSQNVSRVTASVHFDASTMTPRVKLTHSFLGYAGSGLHEVFLFAPADKQKEVVKEICNIAAKTEDIDSFKVENAAFSSYSAGKPLEITAVISTPALLERAGSKYLFKVGDIIGRQNELYQENKRSLPIDIEFPHDLPRSIRIRIPEGYKVMNPEAVRMNVLYDPAHKDQCGFISDYSMEGDELVVDIHEYYRDVSYPVSGYEAYRKVINAAADFNKVVLILQKI